MPIREVLGLFEDNPNEEFTPLEIAFNLRVNPNSVRRDVRILYNRGYLVRGIGYRQHGYTLRTTKEDREYTEEKEINVYGFTGYKNGRRWLIKYCSSDTLNEPELLRIMKIIEQDFSNVSFVAEGTGFGREGFSYEDDGRVNS